MEGFIKKSASDVESTESGSMPQSPDRSDNGGSEEMKSMFAILMEKIDKNTENVGNAIIGLKTELGSSIANLSHSVGDLKTELGTVKDSMTSLKAEIGEEVDNKLDNLSKKFENKDKDLHTRLGTVVDELKGEIDTGRQTCDDRYESTKQTFTEVNKKIKTGIEEAKILLTNKLKSTETNFKESIETVNNRISNLEFSTASGNTSWTMLQLPSGKTFTGGIKYHAVDFIAACKDQFILGMTEEYKIKIAKRMLEGAALTWANQCASQFNTFEDFERLFLNKYWSQTKQVRLQNEFLNGPSYVAGKQSMLEFCQEELRKLVHLDQPLGTLPVISTLCRRLPEDLNWELVHCPTDSIENFLNFIERIDNAMAREPRPQDTHHSHKQKGYNEYKGNKNWDNHNRERNFNENWRGNSSRNNNENKSQQNTWDNNNRGNRWSEQEGESNTRNQNRRGQQGN